MRQNVLLLSLLFAIVGNVTAQEPIAMDGKEWHIRSGFHIYYSDHHIWIDGDTIVNGVSCKKMYTLTKELYDEGKETLEVGYCRQDGAKFYKNGRLLFDLSLQVGEVMSSSDYEVVDAGYFVTKDGVSRKCLTVEYDGGKDVWVEGFGSLEMGIYDNKIQSGMNLELVSYSHNSHPVFYHEPIALEGKEWVLMTQGVAPSNIRMWIEGDTIVDGMTCKKLYKQTCTNDGVETLEVGFCRQDRKIYWQNNKVMFLFGGIDSHMSYESSDWNTMFYNYRTVDSGYANMDDGMSRQYTSISDDYWSETPEIKDIWIEGVGSKNTGIFEYSTKEERDDVILLSCSYKGQYIYKNPNANIKDLPYQPLSTSYYDLQGRKVAHPTRGIYIKDGKKVVIKSEE